MYIIRIYSAGMRISESKQEKKELSDFLKTVQKQLRNGDYKIQFGLGVMQVVTEICVDVYEGNLRRYRADLSRAFKR